MLLLLLPLSIFSALYFYLEAMKSAMSPLRWGLAAILLGPLIWPLFRAERRMLWRRQLGAAMVLWSA